MGLAKNTLTYRLEKLKAENPDFEVFVTYDEKGQRQSINFSEFYQLCSRFAYILKQDGVTPGEYVTALIPPSIECCVVTFGILLAGAVPASLEITFKDAEGFLQCMEKIKSRFVITRDESTDEAVQFFQPFKTQDNGNEWSVDFERLPHFKKIMFVGRASSGKVSFLDMLRKSQGEYIYEDVHERMISFLHFTTGTPTDYLKMTEITHGTLLEYCESLKKLNGGNYSKVVYTNPFFWSTAVPYDTLAGMTRVFPDKWARIEDYPELLYQIIKREKIEYADIQPVDAIDVIKIWRQKEDTSKPLLKLHTIMGMPVTLPMLKQFQGWTENINLIYGSHECGATHLNSFPSSMVDSFKDFDCGVPLPGTHFKVVDENMKELPRGVSGRLLLKSAGMFRGYAGEPHRAAKLFDKDRWLVTNDKAVVDETDHLFVGGRIDSIILHGEYMIYPVWIEDMVKPLPEVDKVVAVPVRDPVLFHAPGVCIIKKPGYNLTKEKVVQQVASFIVPQKEFIFHVKHVLFFESYPLKDNGEVDRSKLFDLVNEMVEAQ